MTNNELKQQAEKAYNDQNFEEAVKLYNQIIAKNPNDARAFSERGISHFHLNNFEQSLNDMNEAVKLEPTNGYRYASRGYIKAALKQTEDAILDYKKATELDPEDSLSFNNIGLLQEQLGWNQQAQKSFDKADTLERDKNPTPIPSNTLAEKPKTENNNNITIEKNEFNSSAEVLKSVLTQKETFKEFISFVKNGFKLK